MSAKRAYSSPLDKKIASLESQLDKLKRQRLAELQSIMARLRSDLGGSAPAESKGSGPRGARLSDAEALAKIMAVVKAAGSAGVSGRQISDQSGVFYPRAIKLATKHCKKVGKAKWTRYFAK